MKLKYYLRGMGIGIIVTTVILMIVFALHKNETLTDDQIRERAAALGMVMPDALSDSEKLSNPVEDDGNDTASDEAAASDQKDAADAQTPAAKPQTNGKDTSQNVGKSDQADQTDKSDQTDQADKSDKNNVETIEQVELSIVGGEYSDDVCKKLKRAGVIDDADDFNKYLSEGGYDSLIQPGTYIIPKDADYDTIIKMITERNDDKNTDQKKDTKSKK